jgi:hypothetical protein
MPKKDDPEKKLSRSVRLRKYGTIYKSFVRKLEQTKKSPRRSRYKTSHKEREKQSRSIEKKKTLNSFQKFVQSESKKDCYKKIPGKERLAVIASAWKKINKK